jgi:hypothetical protein
MKDLTGPINYQISMESDQDVEVLKEEHEQEEEEIRDKLEEEE